jgi:hypothetical protein
MYRKLITATAASILVLGSAGTASAQTWSGPVDLFSSVSLGCSVNASISSSGLAAGSTGTTTSTQYPFVARSGLLSFLCPTVEILQTNWTTTIGASTDGGDTYPVTISGIEAKTTTGTTCQGSVTGEFKESTQELKVNGTLNPGTTTCDISLVLTPSPALYL